MVEMGFDRLQSEYATRQTRDAGVERAIDWLMSNMDSLPANLADVIVAADRPADLSELPFGFASAEDPKPAASKPAPVAPAAPVAAAPAVSAPAAPAAKPIPNPIFNDAVELPAVPAYVPGLILHQESA